MLVVPVKIILPEIVRLKYRYSHVSPPFTLSLPIFDLARQTSEKEFNYCEYNKNTILYSHEVIDKISIKRLKFYSKIGFRLQQIEHIH